MLAADAVLATPGTVPVTPHWQWSGAAGEADDVLLPTSTARTLLGRAVTFFVCVLGTCTLAGLDLVVDATG